MTRRQQESTIIFVAGVILGILILSFTAFSCEAADEPLPPKPGDFIQVPNNPNLMKYYSPAPLTTSRFITYGQLTATKGLISPDLSTQDKITPIGKDLYDRLLRIKTSKGFFALRVVVIQHATVSLFKYETVQWEDILPELEKNFSALEN